MSVSESEAPSVASFFVARRRDIAVLALFWCCYGYLCCLKRELNWLSERLPSSFPAVKAEISTIELESVTVWV